MNPAVEITSFSDVNPTEKDLIAEVTPTETQMVWFQFSDPEHVRNSEMFLIRVNATGIQNAFLILPGISEYQTIPKHTGLIQTVSSPGR